MNELHKPDDEHFFFRQEMRCEERLRSGWDWLVIRLFGLVSDYGHSVTRPALGLLAAVILGWIGFTIQFEWQAVREGGMQGAGEALALSLSNTVAFLGFNRLYFGTDYFAAIWWPLRVLAATQTVAGVIFLFFLGLGLRNRFRLK